MKCIWHINCDLEDMVFAFDKTKSVFVIDNEGIIYRWHQVESDSSVNLLSEKHIQGGVVDH